MMGLGMGLGLLGLLLMIVFWAGLILLAIWGVKVLFSGGTSTYSPVGTGAPARQILDQRYARGEITHDQYDLMKKDLQIE